jgi:hydrogenase-4 component F
MQQYGTKTLRELRGVLATQPSQAVWLFLGVIAVAGTPPFGSFLAEWQILSVAADARHPVTVIVLCMALAVAFMALSTQAASMVFGHTLLEHPGTVRAPTPGWTLTAVPGMLVTASLLLGVMLPPAAFLLLEGGR